MGLQRLTTRDVHQPDQIRSEAKNLSRRSAKVVRKAEVRESGGGWMDRGMREKEFSLNKSVKAHPEMKVVSVLSVWTRLVLNEFRGHSSPPGSPVCRRESFLVLYLHSLVTQKKTSCLFQCTATETHERKSVFSIPVWAHY